MNVTSFATVGRTERITKKNVNSVLYKMCFKYIKISDKVQSVCSVSYKLPADLMSAAETSLSGISES